ncbi:MAG: adenylosuccinate synthase [Candidatus Gracilibacteria bacterium]|nr:adenylosuccinate synthase [Candidatus Gracilibacteria bacterium]
MSTEAKILANLTAVLGTQWGDEGKGKLIDILAQKFDIIARATGGANAGHTIYIPDPNNPEKPQKFVFHLVPAGMLTEGKICVVGNGVVMHLPTFFEELQILEDANIKTEGRIFVSDRVHLLFKYHKEIDGLQETAKSNNKIGTTKRGIGPCYTDKIRRIGIRLQDLMDFETFEKKYRENVEMLQKEYGKFDYDIEKELSYYKKILDKVKPMVVDSAYYLNNALDNGKTVLVEGANGTLLDIDHGTYPFVTSSNASAGGIITGIGVGPRRLGSVIGIMKAYTTRVGGGPFPTELLDELGEKIRTIGGEFGATTGRPRRCGWFDAVVGKYSVMINTLTSINLTKLDVLTGLPFLKIATAYKYKGEKLNSFPSSLEILENIEIEYIEMPGWTEDLSKVRKFEDLPANAQAYVKKIEELIGCRANFIGVGIERGDMIFRD